MTGLWKGFISLKTTISVSTNAGSLLWALFPLLWRYASWWPAAPSPAISDGRNGHVSEQGGGSKSRKVYPL